MAILLPAVLVLVPLAIAPHVLFYFDVTPKVAILLLGTALALPWFRCDALPFRALVAVQGLSLAISTIFSTHPALSLTGTNWRRFGFITQGSVLLFALMVAADPRRVRRLLRAIAAAGMLAALYGILQYFGWDPWLPAQAYHVGEGIWTIVRPPSTLGHAGYFATYLLYVVFAGCGLRMTEASRKWRALGMIAAALGSAAIVLSGARAAILGLVVGFVFLLMWLRPRIRTRAVAGAIALLVGGAVFYFSPAGQKLRSRTHWYIEDPRGGMRLWIWRDALRMGGRHWLAGTGLETFSSEFPRFESDSLARAYPDFYHESPHNIFLDALTAQGAPGLIVLLGLSGLGFYAAWRARHAERVVSGALGAALAAGLFSQQFSSFTLPTAMYFYVTIALLVAVMVRRQTVGQALPPAFKLVLLVIVAVFAMRLVVADVLLARVQRHLETGQVKQAIETYQGFERWQPPGASSDLWYSRSLAAAAQKAPTPLAAVQGWQQAMEAAIRAAQRSEDRHNAYYNLAAFYAHVNDFPHTEQSLRAAIAWAPNWFKPHWMLAQVLRAAGRLPEARAEAALAADLNGGKNPEVARTWEEIRASSKVD